MSFDLDHWAMENPKYPGRSVGDSLEPWGANHAEKYFGHDWITLQAGQGSTFEDQVEIVIERIKEIYDDEEIAVFKKMAKEFKVKADSMGLVIRPVFM